MKLRVQVYGGPLDGREALIDADKAEPLRLRCYNTFALKWLIPRLPRFQVDHPGIEAWAGKAYLDQFFLRPADPEAYDPASHPTGN